MYYNLQNILKLLLIPLAAWFLVHILAIFGIFIIVIYPIWWLLSPTWLAPCLYCFFKEDRHTFVCPVCLRQYQNGLLVSGRPLISISRNMGLILIFTFISLGLVYLESRLLFRLGFPPTPKTVSFVIPSQNQYRLGEIFPMKIEIVGIKTPINVVQTDISFDPSKVRVVNISTKDSFANIFIQKEINNDIGYARLTGGLPNPGFSLDHGLFGTIYFQGKNPGLVKIDFLPSSQVLANDGRGTNVLTKINSASYLITPEELSPQEEELQNNLTSDRSVLGEEDDKSTQILLYQEKPVLGLQTEKQIIESKKFNIINFFNNLIEAIDRFTLDLWTNIFYMKK